MDLSISLPILLFKYILLSPINYRDKQFLRLPVCTQCSELGSWRYGKIQGVDKVLLQFKKFLFVLFNPTAESVNCSLLLKNLEKHIRDLAYKKKIEFFNTLKIYHIYRINLSAIIYRLQILPRKIDLSV